MSVRERRLVKITAGIAAAALLYLYIVEPRIITWTALEAGIRDAAHRYQKLSVLVENEDIIRDRYARLSKTFASKGSQSADAIHFFEFLGSLDSGTSFRVRDIRPVPTRATDEPIERTSVVIFCEGSIDGLEQFLRQLAASEQALKLDKLSFSLPRPDAPLKITATISKTVRRVP